MLQRPGLPDLFVAGTDHIAQTFQDAVHLHGIGNGRLPLFAHLEGRIRCGDGRQLEGQHVLRTVRPFLCTQTQQMMPGTQGTVRQVIDAVPFQMDVPSLRAALTQAMAQAVEIDFEIFAFYFKSHGYAHCLR